MKSNSEANPLAHIVSPWYWVWHTCRGIRLGTLEGATRRCPHRSCPPATALEVLPPATRSKRLWWPESWARQPIVVYYGTPAQQPQYQLMMFVQKLACCARRRQTAREDERERSQAERPHPHLISSQLQAKQSTLVLGLAGKPWSNEHDNWY